MLNPELPSMGRDRSKSRFYVLSLLGLKQCLSVLLLQRSALETVIFVCLLTPLEIFFLTECSGFNY